MTIRPVLFALGLAALVQAGVSAAETVTIIPRPMAVTITAELPLVLTAATPIHAVGGEGVNAVAAHLRTVLSTLTGLGLSAADGTVGDGIVLRLDSALVVEGPEWAVAEAYRLSVAGKRVEVVARSAHGLFNGVQSLMQLAMKDGEGWRIPAVTINDQPRFRWRGLMLDSGRHFFSVAEVERFIDLMALHKFNRFHWHLTEDQGWRIELKKYPKLTSVGAWRAESPLMGDAKHGDGQPYGGFYTQDDIRAVVAHAAARFITVVPEIEMPGHSAAAVAAYPELGNHDITDWQAPAVMTKWGVIHRTLSPRDETFAFIAAVFDEVLPLFPGEYVHIGGDEAPKDEWKKSPFAQKIIADNKLGDEHGLQSWFIKRVEGLLAARGKRLIGWDEIQEGGLSPTATMMVWRDWKWATLALEHGNTVVMAPSSHTYLDHGQGANAGGPVYQVIGGSLLLEKVYGLDPVPGGVSAAQAANVLGTQGQVWSEYIWSQAKVEYMTWPRACALAEVAWSPIAGREWSEFRHRLDSHLLRLDRLGVNYRRDDGAPAQPAQSMERTPRMPKP